MDAQIKGKRLGITSIVIMFISLFLFYTQLLIDIGLYIEIVIYGGLSIVGMILAIYSAKLMNKSKLSILGIAGNSFMLFISVFLVLIMMMVESQ